MPKAEVVLNPFVVLNEPAPARERGVRGRDRKKLDIEWHDVQRVYKYDDGSYIGYVGDPRDTATLGNVMGHCSGCHFVWTHEEKIWYFFALFDSDDIPHYTLHGKQASWVDKPHPRDSCPPIPVPITTDNMYGYPSLAEVESCFQKAGLKYEPGKYKPYRYNSCTYDYGLRDGDMDTFEYRIGRALVVRNRPPDVDADVWDAYAKAAKAVEDNYNTNVGAVKMIGRRFKFDGKWLILLSASNKSQGTARGDAKKKIVEWLNSTTRKEKK